MPSETNWLALEILHLKVGGFTPCEGLTGAAGERTAGSRSREQQMLPFFDEAGGVGGAEGGCEKPPEDSIGVL